MNTTLLIFAIKGEDYVEFDFLVLSKIFILTRKGNFERLKAPVYERLRKNNNMKRKLKSYSKKSFVCPVCVCVFVCFPRGGSCRRRGPPWRSECPRPPSTALHRRSRVAPRSDASSS